MSLSACLSTRCPAARLLLIAIPLMMFLPAALAGCGAATSAPRAVGGILDLREWDFSKNGPVPLNGEWAFYWSDFLVPSEVPIAGRGVPRPVMIPVPGSWNDVEAHGTRVPGDGYATYHLKILMGNHPPEMGLKFLDAAVSFACYANGSLIAVSGVPGKTASSTTPGYQPQVTRLPAISDALDLRVHVSNFHHRKGGLWEPILLGTADQVKTLREKSVSLDLFLFGSILIMGIYQLGLYIVRRTETASLFFAVFCFLIAFRMITTGERYLVRLFPNLDWETLVSIPYVTFYLTVPVFGLYLKTLFKKEFSRTIISVITIAGCLSAAIVLVTPIMLYSHTLPGFQVFAVASFFYGLQGTVRAVIRRREGAIALLAGFMILIIVSVNDILYSNQIVATGYWIPFGLLLFIFFQALFLASRFARAMKIVELQRHTLIESESKYRTLFQESMEPMSLLQSGKLIDVNTAWMKLHGYENRAEVLGSDVVRFVHPEDECIISERRQAWPNLRQRVFQVRDVRRDGTVIFLEVYSSRVVIDGQDAILTTMHDITERKRVAEENFRLQLQLQQADKLKAIGTLAGGIAHDFNNILASTIGYTDLARFEVANPTQIPQISRYLEEIKKASLRARDLVRQILAFSRQSRMELRPVKVGDILKEALSLLRAAMPANIAIHTQIEDNTPVVTADPTQMHQVIMNLCTNANNAMENVGGVLTAGLKSVDLTEEDTSALPEIAPGRYLLLEISDTGSGIEPDIMDRIFDPFFTTKARGKGVGMGLSVVHGIIRKHSGAIDIRSAPGKGSLVRVWLPAAAAGPQVEDKDGGPIPAGREQILFVDDEASLTDIARQSLERIGYHVETWNHPAMALDAFRSEPNRFDLVVTDRLMPVMNGRQLAAEIRQLRPDIPIILCTGYGGTEAESQNVSSGIDQVMLKPVEIDSLARAIRKQLDSCQGDTEFESEGF